MQAAMACLPYGLAASLLCDYISRSGFESTSITETATLTSAEQRTNQVAMRQLDVIMEGTVRNAEHRD